VSEEFFLKKFQDYRLYAEKGPPQLSGLEALMKSLRPARTSVETHPGLTRKTQ
jgi:hypothetical protein